MNKSTQTTEKADVFDFEHFLKLCKKHKLSIDTKKTSQGNTKIKHNDKIVFYARSAKIATVIIWNNMISKNQHINNEKEAIELLVKLTEIKKN